MHLNTFLPFVYAVSMVRVPLHCSLLIISLSGMFVLRDRVCLSAFEVLLAPQRRIKVESKKNKKEQKNSKIRKISKVSGATYISDVIFSKYAHNGHMGIWAYVKNMVKWVIPEKSIKNATQKR